MATRVLLGDEGELYGLHHERLTHVVARCVDGSRALIEDACSFAWSQLLCHQPERRPELFGWLCTVAIREGWRLSRLERRDGRLDVEICGCDGPVAMVESVEDRRASLARQLEARAALVRVGELDPRKRRVLALQVAGFSHNEIAALTGDTLRTVERQIRRARARVRIS